MDISGHFATKRGRGYNEHGCTTYFEPVLSPALSSSPFLLDDADGEGDFVVASFRLLVVVVGAVAVAAAVEDELFDAGFESGDALEVLMDGRSGETGGASLLSICVCGCAFNQHHESLGALTITFLLPLPLHSSYTIPFEWSLGQAGRQASLTHLEASLEIEGGLLFSRFAPLVERGGRRLALADPSNRRRGRRGGGRGGGGAAAGGRAAAALASMLAARRWPHRGCHLFLMGGWEVVRSGASRAVCWEMGQKGRTGQCFRSKRTSVFFVGDTC